MSREQKHIVVRKEGSSEELQQLPVNAGRVRLNLLHPQTVLQVMELFVRGFYDLNIVSTFGPSVAVNVLHVHAGSPPPVSIIQSQCDRQTLFCLFALSYPT